MIHKLNDIKYDTLDDMEEHYLSTLKTFDFEIRIDDEDVFKRYYVYGDDLHYTNINNMMGDIEIHINQKSKQHIPFDEDKLILLKNEQHITKESRDYDGNIHTLTIITEITNLYSVLNILYGERLRVKKLERIINEEI